jgi:hypothetical protein
MEIGKCLKDRGNDVSDSCHSFLEKMKLQHDAFREQIEKLVETCRTDSEQLCPNLFGPQQMGCLVQNSAKLSESCKTQVDHMKSAHQSMKTLRNSQ